MTNVFYICTCNPYMKARTMKGILQVKESSNQFINTPFQSSHPFQQLSNEECKRGCLSMAESHGNCESSVQSVNISIKCVAFDE